MGRGSCCHRQLVALLALLLGAFVANNAEQVSVLTANLDGRQRGDSWAELKRKVAAPGDSTLCLRFNIRVFRLLTAVIYIYEEDFPINVISFEVYFEKIRAKFAGYGRYYALPYNLVTNTWYHYCQIRDMQRGAALVYLDGVLMVNETATFKHDPTLRRVLIGQDEFDPPYSFSGRLSQVNLFGSVLSGEEIMLRAKCQETREGDIIGWSDDWTLNNMEMLTVEVQELCAGPRKENVVTVLPPLRFHDAFVTCRGLGGFMNAPRTEEQLHKEMDKFDGFEECNRQWAGITDAVTEDLWRDPFKKIDYKTSELFFIPGNPNGGKYQNCARMHRIGMGDSECKKGSCSACWVPAVATWTFRGICEEELRMYYMDLLPAPMSFSGYGEYTVRQLSDVWTWYDIVTNKTMATFIPEKGLLNYPIGRHMWTLVTEVCGEEGGTLRELALTSCRVGQFTCSDGQCINFQSRCDLKFDCDDKTDESNCDIVNFPDDYRMNLPPRPRSDSALPIAIAVIIDTLNVDTQTMLMSISYKLRMTWYDNRLTFNNLKVLTRLNTLAPTQVNQLWRPLLGYINTDDIHQTAVDISAVTTIVRAVETFRPDLTNSYEVEIYAGDQNPVSTMRKYFTIYTCHFDLTLYPFDIQECFMQIQVLSASNEYLIFNFSASSVQYLGAKYLVEYGIGAVTLTVDNENQYSELRVVVQLVRRYGYAMLNIYIPSVTLLIISVLTLFFRPSLLEVRVMTALTSLLVLATLFTQVSQSLPKTSYFKMVDIWLLFCIIVIFCIIILHALIDQYVDHSASGEVVSLEWALKQGEKTVKEIIKTGTGGLMRNKLKLSIFISRVFIISIFLLFNIIYWGTLCVKSGLVYQY